MPIEPQTASTMILPESLRPIFWHCDFDEVRAGCDREFAIGRVLASGTWDGIRWLLAALGDGVLKDWLRRRKGGPLSPPQLRFWGLILQLPEVEVTDGIQQKARQIWHRR